ncbi:hypothetical protein GCM10011502_25810 [Oceanisphaera marina]|uniref:Uncharacterized protein n=2 Tax=Oceanisphaera marina TaxID=2017550 RepID=A0ABQ1ITD0_9GAMM|nr:hypothetical protein GCM10011502_25810 [Oceanisphaera marina]
MPRLVKKLLVSSANFNAEGRFGNRAGATPYLLATLLPSSFEGDQTVLEESSLALARSATATEESPPVTEALSVCDKQVPQAALSELGNCAFYYQPLHDEYVNKTGVSTWEAIKAWATFWNPWDDQAVAKRLMQKRDALITLDSQDSDWSRHANFMMRHVNCGHLPPNYYLSYGYYYCSIYGAKLYPRLSEQGKKWLKSARYLLQENIEIGLKQNMKGNAIAIECKRYPNRTAQMQVQRQELEIDPDMFKSFAFKTHVPAYLDAGLADLPFSDLAKIGGQPNLEEWLDEQTWEQAIDSGIEVGKDKLRQAGSAVVDSLQDVKAAALEVRRAGKAAIRTAREVRDAAQAVQSALDALTRKFRF